jgi:ribose-phosphate pyrophosphokinase
LSTTRAPLQILSCAAARPLADEVARHLGVPLVRSQDLWFASGECKHTIEENIRGSDLYVFGAPIAPADSRSVYDRFIMVLHALEAASQSDAEWVTAVLPYFPGARQDKRKGRTREAISAGLFARMLQEAGAHRVVTVDIHNEAIGGMFDPSRCRLENVELCHRYAGWLRARGLAGDTVAAPDVGGLERARHFASELAADLVAISKERDYSRPNTVKSSTVIGEAADRDILLVDDIIDTAGSVVAAVQALKREGARNITVACSHPVMSGPAWQRLQALADEAQAGGWRFRVVGSSSIAHAAAPSWFETFPIAPLLGQVIAKINGRGSVTGAQEADEEPTFQL